MSNRRYQGLDSMRGIASAAVVMHHAAPAAGAQYVPGHWAVIFFFVLSGFVLALPWVQGRPPTWSEFFLRRICRLWPPVFVVVLLSIGLSYAIGPRPALWIDFWLKPPTTDLLTCGLLLVGVPPGCQLLIPPLWSLVYEARVSLVFPILVMVISRRPPRDIAIWALFLGIAVEISLWMRGARAWTPYSGDGFLVALILTIHYAALFVFGILLARHADRAVALTDRRALLLLGGAITAMCLPSDMVNGFGATMLIAIVVWSGLLTRALMCAPLRWLGRVSYSLYLVHFPIMFAVSSAQPADWIPRGAIVALVLSALAAEIMFRTVEAPSIRLGRWLTASSAVLPNPANRIL